MAIDQKWKAMMADTSVMKDQVASNDTSGNFTGYVTRQLFAASWC